MNAGQDCSCPGCGRALAQAPVPLRVQAPSTPVEVQKSQEVRLFDVLLLGPFMIGVALTERPSPALRALLGAAGVGTILYNLRNYQLTQERGGP